MELPGLKQATSAKVQLTPLAGVDGRIHVSVVIKQRFALKPDGSVKRVDTAEIRLADKLWDEDAPESSSLEYASDICLHKPAADVLVKGDAMAPGRTPTRTLDVLVRVGELETALKVFGTRVWYKGVGGLCMTDPEPFETQPIRWEHAYGGRDTSAGRLLEASANPVGRGVAASPEQLIHQPLPSIEDPGDLIRSPKSRPQPAGLSPIMHHWSPRKRYAGTHDEQWMRERMPLLPLDFDWRHNQSAPAAMVYPRYLRGGETVDLFHLCDQGALRFRLPQLSFFVGAYLEDQGLVPYPAVCDTLLLEPNDLAFEMVWRSAVPMPMRAHQVRAIQVHERKVLT